MARLPRIAIIGQGYVGQAFREFVSGRADITTYDPATDDEYPFEAVAAADVAVICVPTPSLPDGSCDTSMIETTVKQTPSRFILIKSTVAPGTVDQLIAVTGKEIVFSPEYIGESKYNNPVYQTMRDVPFMILGGEPAARRRMIELFEPITGPSVRYYQCTALEAELVKYMENAYLATKVTFVNEFFDIAERYGADWQAVREGWLLDERIGRAFSSVFVNNRGFDGKCLPKDLRAIVAAAKAKDYDPVLLQAVQTANQRYR